jgi:hypothetical protein
MRLDPALAEMRDDTMGAPGALEADQLELAELGEPDRLASTCPG